MRTLNCYNLCSAGFKRFVGAGLLQQQLVQLLHQLEQLLHQLEQLQQPHFLIMLTILMHVYLRNQV